MALISKTTLLPLNDGGQIPVFGIGVYLAKANGEAEQSCLWALENGYRMIDTAAIYKNEEEVGSALRKCGLPREEVYVTTKLWNADHGRQKTIDALKLSLKKLGVDYVDLYLMHSLVGGATVETWQTMVELKRQGLTKSVGVSNFNVYHLEKLLEATPDSVPSVNQIELHPYLTRENITTFCKDKGIVVEAYSPLTKGQKLNDPKLLSIAQKYGKSTAQVLIRWCLQHGFVCIPKSIKESRIKDNGEVFDFNISPEDMSTMDGWNEDLITAWDVMNTDWIP